MVGAYAIQACMGEALPWRAATATTANREPDFSERLDTVPPALLAVSAAERVTQVSKCQYTGCSVNRPRGSRTVMWQPSSRSPRSLTGTHFTLPDSLCLEAQEEALHHRVDAPMSGGAGGVRQNQRLQLANDVALEAARDFPFFPNDACPSTMRSRSTVNDPNVRHRLIAEVGRHRELPSQ